MFQPPPKNRFKFTLIALVLPWLGLIQRMDGQQSPNPIVAENSLSGNLPSEWDVSGIGNPSIQGFATEFSVNRGETVNFKIKTDASAYRIDIYRLGYYGGRGARKVATILPSANLPQTQPAFARDANTGLIDCGTWAVSASWPVPANATSGVYIARPVRADNGGASHIIFIVRNDAGKSDLLFQTSDTKWQAYNDYGGANLYRGNGPGGSGRAYKVSYNRPFNNRAASMVGTGAIEGFLFATEYPMIRWLEANGYNVSYASGMDTDRRGAAALLTHRVFLSVGHDEYWSGRQRANVEAARAAGVNLGFFSANQMFWKTRWENSIAGPVTPYRTMVCYKETHANAKIDPTAEWTGTWRDPRFSPPADGGRPENAVSGQLYMVDAFRYDPIDISSGEGKLRFWRNTGIDTLAAGQTARLPNGVLGFEIDEVVDNGFLPAGMIRMSKTTVNVNSYLQNYGSTYAPGTGTHSLTLYRHNSGALVFGAGTIQWAWGLDAVHDFPSTPVDIRMQQATVNLFADMGVQPLSLQSWLMPAIPSGDTQPPDSVIHTPSGSTMESGTLVTITGTATDAGGGRPAGVEFSYDGGASWHPATGTSNWSATWRTPNTPGLVTLKSRAVDDSGRIETPGPGATILVIPNTYGSHTLWPSSTIPGTIDHTDAASFELGVKFKSDRNGWIKAIRFYKCALNTGTHTGHLWSGNGTLLATAVFNNETSSGWQEAQLPTPVLISAGTTYIASYHLDSGHFSMDASYFTTGGQDSAPLHALASGVSGANGVFHTGSSAFPTDSWNSTNYWVDVVFSDAKLPDLPAAPGGLTAALESGTQVKLAWTDNSTNESSFKIERKTTAGGTYVEIATIGANVNTFTDTAPAANATYYYRVRATNDRGSSAYSSETSATTFNTAPVAVADFYRANQNTTLFVTTAGVLANDNDEPSSPLTASLITGPAHGSLTLNPNGGFTYLPAAGYIGSDSFTYHANDGSLNSNAATVTIDIRQGVPGVLINGSFESDYAGWTHTGNQSIASTGAYTAANGTKMIAFNAGQTSPNAVLTQSFATVPGQNYHMTFDMGIFAANTNDQRLLVALTGNTTLFSQTYSIISPTSGASRWLSKSLIFTADSNSTNLTFRDVSLSTDSLDLLLDNVWIVPLVPRTLTVESSPQAGVNVTVCPLDNNGDYNGSASFSRIYPQDTVVSLVAPAASGSFLFQKWMKDGMDFSATPAISVPMDGDHLLTAVYMENAPLITGHPASVSAGVGTSATFHVTAEGTGNLTYQWYFNGNQISGAQTDTYTIGNVQNHDSGTYTVTVANAAGAVTSTPATLSVITQSLVNGSFESDFTGWTHTGNQGIASTAVYLTTNGTKLVAFNGGQTNPNAVLSQSFSTRAGQNHTLAFDLGVMAYNTNAQALQVTVTGAGNLVSQTITINGLGGGIVRWLAKSISFVADGPSATLSFRDVSTTGDNIDMLLDNVRVESVAPPNTAPIAVDDSYSLNRDSAIGVPTPGILGNDTDPQSDLLSAVMVSGPAHGSLSLNPDGSLTYTPIAGYEGTDSFTYKTNDGSLDSNLATVSINVDAVGSSLVANGSFEQGAFIESSSGPIPFNHFTLDHWEATGNPCGLGQLSNVPVTDGVRMAIFNGANNTYGGTISQTLATIPGATYELSYDAGICGNAGAIQHLGVTVTGNGGAALLTTTAQEITLTSVTTNTTIWTPASSRFTANGTTAILAYTDKSGSPANGSDMLLDHVMVRLVATNSAPTAIAQSISMDKGGVLPITLTGYDIDGDNLTFSAGAPSHGTLTGAAPFLSYVPAPNYTGPDSFTFTVNDGTVNSAVAAVMIIVNPLELTGTPTLIRIDSINKISIVAQLAGFYELQRSSDLQTWGKIGEINLTEPGPLDFTDQSPPAAPVFYRIALRR